MRKRNLLIILILVLTLTTIVISGCSFTKSTKVIVEDRDIESIEVLFYNSNGESTKYVLTSGEMEDITKLFDNLGYIDRQYVSNPIISETFDYSLKIDVAKKGLKKAYTYYVYIGRTYSYKVNDKDILNQTESKYLLIETDQLKYKGEVNEEILNYLGLIRASL